MQREPITTVIVAILSTDRDCHLIEDMHTSLTHLRSVCVVSTICVCRETDVQALACWAKRGIPSITVPHYEIHFVNSWPQNAELLNRAMAYAIAKDADAVLFLDSDTIPSAAVTTDMLQCSLTADVVAAPYNMRWSGEPTVGVIKDGKIYPVNATHFDPVNYQQIHFAGIGCTLIRRAAMGVKFCFAKIGELSGVDLGWFLKLRQEHPELVVRSTRPPNFPTHMAACQKIYEPTEGIAIS